MLCANLVYSNPVTCNKVTYTSEQYLKYSLYYDTLIIQVDLVVAEIHSVKEQRHKTEASSSQVNLNFYLIVPSLVSGELATPNTTTPTVTPPAPTVQPHSCPDGQFVCAAHGECVANHKVCDFRRDCSDGSDELSCGKTFIFSQNLYKENSLFSPSNISVLFLSFPSEGAMWFRRRWHLWLVGRLPLSGTDPHISLVGWPRGEHSWRRAVPPSCQWPHHVSPCKRCVSQQKL